jgi:hypothetical protein
MRQCYTTASLSPQPLPSPARKRPHFLFLGTGIAGVGFFCVTIVFRVCWRIVANGEAAKVEFLMIAGRRADSAVLFRRRVSMMRREQERESREHRGRTAPSASSSPSTSPLPSHLSSFPHQESQPPPPAPPPLLPRLPPSVKARLQATPSRRKRGKQRGCFQVWRRGGRDGSGISSRGRRRLEAL